LLFRANVLFEYTKRGGRRKAIEGQCLKWRLPMPTLRSTRPSEEIMIALVLEEITFDGEP
jgi:hypothetical protein